MAGIPGPNTGLQSANSGHDLMQLAALLGGSQQQSVMFQPAWLLQVRHALAQQQATVAAIQQTEIQKRTEAKASPPPLSQIQGVATGLDVIASAAGAARGRRWFYMAK